MKFLGDMTRQPNRWDLNRSDFGKIEKVRPTKRFRIVQFRATKRDIHSNFVKGPTSELA
jgi:hypothetical protein